jgi:ATP-binding cassette subfamily B protein
MREALRALALMIEISLRADTPRSIAAVVTATGTRVANPMRAVGIRMFTDGVIGANLPLAVSGIAIVAGLTIVTRIAFWASFNVRMRLRENTMVYLDTLIMQLTAGIPGLEHHERPEYLDNVEVVRSERWALANPFNPISWTLASVFQVVSVFVLLGSVHPLLMLLPLGGIPSIWATLTSQRAVASLRESQAEPNRRMHHLQELTTDVATAKEIRIYGLSDALIRRRLDLFGDLEQAHVRQGIRNVAAGAAGWGFFAICFVAAIVFAAQLAAQGLITVGAVMLVLSLSAQVNNQLSELIWNLVWLVRTHRTIRRLLWLQDYAADAHASTRAAVPAHVPSQLTDGIRLSGVSFRYPGTDRTVLESVDLYLPAGSTVAVVGENGAGKTTLTKLLCRFYEPTGGTITVDGVDLRTMPIAAWRRRLAAGFQDYATLQLVARESIGVGQTERIHDDDSLAAALERAAADDLRSTLPDDFDTQLGREFEGGLDLSLGQWQKVALGRAMMREQPLLLILDEPTASLDAPTEHRLFDHFATAARRSAAASGAITLLVSHRFSTVLMADLILVIADGRIVEHGTHTALLRRGGLYAELYGLQASAYR